MFKAKREEIVALRAEQTQQLAEERAIIDRRRADVVEDQIRWREAQSTLERQVTRAEEHTQVSVLQSDRQRFLTSTERALL